MKEQIKQQLIRELGAEFTTQIDTCVEKTVEAITRWIPVEEALPILSPHELEGKWGWSEEVLVRDKHRALFKGFYNYKKGVWYMDKPKEWEVTVSEWRAL